VLCGNRNSTCKPSKASSTAAVWWETRRTLLLRCTSSSSRMVHFFSARQPSSFRVLFSSFPRTSFFLSYCSLLSVRFPSCNGVTFFPPFFLLPSGFFFSFLRASFFLPRNSFPSVKLPEHPQLSCTVSLKAERGGKT
jgi:hypothetical protein